MSIAQKIEDAPALVSLAVMAAGWAVSVLQPIAILVTIMWGTLQIYGWLEKRYRKTKTQRRRKGD